MASIVGMRDVADVIAELKDKPQSWRLLYSWLNPNGEASLYALSALKETHGLDSDVHNWFCKRYPTRRIALTADLNNTDVTTTLTMASGALQFKLYDILQIEHTGEQVIVAAEPTVDTALSVTRGFAGTTKTALTVAGAGVNPNAILVSQAHPQGSDAPEARYELGTHEYNLSQIFRDTADITRTMEKVKMRTGGNWKEQLKEGMQNHSLTIERAIMFSRRSTSVVDGKTRHTMNGIISLIESASLPRVFDLSTLSSNQLAMYQFEEYMRQLFLYGSKQKLCFMGSRAAKAINQMVRRNNAQFIVDKDQIGFGMNIHRFAGYGGELIMKTHPMLSYIGGGTTAGVDYHGWDTWMLIIDQAHLKYLYMEDAKFDPNMRTPGKDARKAGWLTEMTIEMDFPESFMLIKGVDEGVADV